MEVNKNKIYYYVANLSNERNIMFSRFTSYYLCRSKILKRHAGFQIRWRIGKQRGKS